MLLFFTLTTVFGLTKFHNQQWRPFSFDWWFWLAFTGFNIGCVSRCVLVQACSGPMLMIAVALNS
jgi:dolichyl-phosphate-mannose--protein O-mannosyl transferase